MKKLDLSVLPIDLKVGECMQVVDRKGRSHIIECEKLEVDKHTCDGCFFENFEAEYSFCNDYVMCAARERETKDDVRYKEVELEVITDRNIDKLSDMPVGTKFIYKNSNGYLFKTEVAECSEADKFVCEKCALECDCYNPKKICMSKGRPDKKDVNFPYKEL